MKPIIKEAKRGWLNLTIWSRNVDKKILKISKHFGITFIVIFIITASAITIGNEIMDVVLGDEYDSEGSYADESYGEESNCNVLGINIHGDIATYISKEYYDKDVDGYLVDQTASEDVVSYIQSAQTDEDIKAIFLEIDSTGGSPTAGEEIANTLKLTTKPTVVMIRNAGLSSAYYAATGADVIFASQHSDVGSIGVTWSYLDYAEKNKKEGSTYNQVSSGVFKDMGDPDKPLTAAEKELAMRDINIMKENFIKAVAENRKLDIEKVRRMADGSTMLGQMALENGLVDKIGGINEVQDYLTETIGEEPEFCWQ
ncbi:MAG: signal peptide peptidase SppA [bacterium]